MLNDDGVSGDGNGVTAMEASGDGSDDGVLMEVMMEC